MKFSLFLTGFDNPLFFVKTQSSRYCFRTNARKQQSWTNLKTFSETCSAKSDEFYATQQAEEEKQRGYGSIWQKYLPCKELNKRWRRRNGRLAINCCQIYFKSLTIMT